METPFTSNLLFCTPFTSNLLFCTPFTSILLFCTPFTSNLLFCTLHNDYNPVFCTSMPPKPKPKTLPTKSFFCIPLPTNPFILHCTTLPSIITSFHPPVQCLSPCILHSSCLHSCILHTPAYCAGQVSGGIPPSLALPHPSPPPPPSLSPLQ